MNDTDDPTISDASPLWRRIPPMHIIFDENLGRLRPSKAAFEDHPNGSAMSVVLADLVLEAGRDAESALVGHAGLARSKKQGVLRKPLPDEPAHAEVVGRKTASVKKALAMNCEWVVLPPDFIVS